MLAVAGERALRGLGDAVMPSAHAQPFPITIPARVTWGLSAAPAGVGSPLRDSDAPPGAGATCCGGSPALTPRSAQATLQRSLTTLWMGVVATAYVQALRDDVIVLIERSKLRRAMLCEANRGLLTLPSGCWEAHHIVAIGDRRAERSRDILREAGIDIDSLVNGVPMECDKHRSMHTDEYHEKVRIALERTDRSTFQVAAALVRIRIQLKANTF
jgi:hypothetical protein